MKFKEIIFVIGGAGFIGSNYLNKFVPLRPEILFVNIDCLTYAGRLENMSVSPLPNYRFEKTDIRNLNKLEKLFKKYRPSGVINFAAESHVDVSIASPDKFIETNVLGTHNLLKLSRRFGVKRFHQISTDEVYGSLGLQERRFTEKSPLLPNSPYSASKAAADCLVRAYGKTYGLDVVITRASNNYGSNQDDTKFIPLFIKKFLGGEKAPLYGKGENIRDWLFVEDHIEAVDLVFRKGESGEVYNVGGNCELSNKEIVEKLLALSGKNWSLVKPVADRPGHDFRYGLDCRKIKKELGWKPKVSFEKGLAKTFSFYARRFAA